MAALTWRDVSTGIDPNESILGVGAGMISKGLEAPAGIIGQIGGMLKGQEVRQKDLLANEYIMQQQDAEDTLKKFLAEQTGNPLLSPELIDSRSGQLAFVDRDTFLAGQAASKGLDYTKMTPQEKAQYLGKEAAVYDKTSKNKDALQSSFDAIRSGLDNSRTMQRTLTGLYSQDSQWLTPDEVNAKAASLTSGFGGVADKEAILENKKVREALADNDLNYGIQDITMKQEGINQRIASETVDYSKFQEGLKGKDLLTITTGLFDNAGNYAGFADSATGIVLKNWQETGQTWENGRGQEIGDAAEKAAARIERKLEFTIKKAPKDSSEQIEAKQKLASFKNYKNVLWLQTLTDEGMQDEWGLGQGGMDLKRSFGLFGENDDKASEYFEGKLMTKLEGLHNNEKAKQELLSQKNALEDSKNMLRVKRLNDQSIVDQEARSRINQASFRDLLAFPK